MSTTKKIHCHFDHISNDEIIGWAVSKENDEVSYDLHVGYRKVAKNVKVELERNDVKEHFKSDSNKHGFQIKEVQALLFNKDVAVTFKGGSGSQKVKLNKMLKDAFSLKYKVEGCKNGELAGWIFSVGNKIDDISIHIDGAVVDGVECRKRGDVKRANPESDINSGFIAKLANKYRDGREHIVTLLVKVGTTTRKIEQKIQTDLLLLGNVDRIDGNGLCHGWAVDYASYDSPTELDVFINDAYFDSLTAANSRSDLKKLEIHHKYGGFRYQLPFSHINDELVNVEFRFKNGSILKSKNKVEGCFSDLSEKTTEIYPLPKSLSNVTVIVPVYNAYDEVKLCLDSYLRHTKQAFARLLIVNDCSPDERIKPMLDSYNSHDNVTIFHNEKNLGYTATVNRGAELAGNDDIVLLNSDTIVTSRWLVRMRATAASSENIGTVTAVSNGAGAFSVPEIGFNDIEYKDIDNFALSLAQSAVSFNPEVPTGNGFCFYIKRAVLNEIGDFNVELFPKGYGEENEFSMRALSYGWRHVIDDKTYVYHHRSASFKGSKAKLLEHGRKVVDEKYPNYKFLVKTFSTGEKFKLMRSNARHVHASYNAATVKPRILFVISTKTGGTPQTNRDLMGGVKHQYSPFLLICDSKEIELYDCTGEDEKLIEKCKLKENIDFISHESYEYDQAVYNYLLKYNIELLHIRHIAWHSVNLPAVAKKLDIPVVFSLHDFYMACPTVNMIDSDNVFHENGVSNKKGDVILWKQGLIPKVDEEYLGFWKTRSNKILSACDYFVTTDQSAKDILSKNLEVLKQREKDFKVIPHGRNFDEFIMAANLPRPSEPLRVLLLGNIGPSKGSEYIKLIKDMDVNNEIEFFVAGRCKKDILPYVTHCGEYNRDDFQEVILNIRPHVSAIISIWPETYCHTLTESWATGIPVVATALGAVKNRMEKHKCGWLIDNISPDSIYNALINISNNVDDYFDKLKNLAVWQSGYGCQNNIDSMSEKYISLYSDFV